MIVTDGDFRALVGRMRKAQRDYFRTRDRTVLATAQRLEREVDQVIADRDRSGDLDFAEEVSD